LHGVQVRVPKHTSPTHRRPPRQKQVLIVKLAASVEEQRKLLWHNLFNDQLDLLFVVLLWLAVSDQEAPTSTIMTIFMMRLNVGLFVVSLTPYTPAPASLQRAL